MNIERQFELETHPEMKRYTLHCNYHEETRTVTMKDIEEAFKKNPVELLRIKNNTSATWWIEEMF